MIFPLICPDGDVMITIPSWPMEPAPITCPPPIMFDSEILVSPKLNSPYLVTGPETPTSSWKTLILSSPISIITILVAPGDGVIVYSSTDQTESCTTLTISDVRPSPSIQAATNTSSSSSSRTSNSGIFALSPAGAWKLNGV